jgi:2TM domain
MKEDKQEASMHDEDVRKPTKKRDAHYIDIKAHGGAFIIVNAFLYVVWKLSNVDYPWPLWVVTGWGLGLAGHIFGRELARTARR